MFRGTSQHSHTRSCCIYGGFQRSWYGADANPDGVADAFMCGVCFKVARIALTPHNCRVIQALTLLSLNVATVFLHPVFLMFFPPLSAGIIYSRIRTFLEHYSALCSEADDVFVPRPGGARPEFALAYVVASTSAVLRRKVFIWNSSNIFITSLRFRTNSLNGCTSEPLSGYLCSRKAQLQLAGLNYFCVHIHQAEMARVNSWMVRVCSSFAGLQM